MKSVLKKKSEFYKCLYCGRIFEPVGDDYWIECPYCISSKYRKAIEGKDFILKDSSSKSKKECLKIGGRSNNA